MPIMTFAQDDDNIPVNNFLIAKNLLTIAKKEIKLWGNHNEFVYIEPEIYKSRLAEWRYFRTTGQLDVAWDHVYDIERAFYAFCSRSHQPFMFVTSDEVLNALGDAGTPYVFTDEHMVRQIYRSVFRDYFATIPINSDWKTIYQQPYIRRCVGEMVLGRHLYPMFFDGLDEELEWITLFVDPSSSNVRVHIANQQNIVIYKQHYPLNDNIGFPRSHLDILADVIKIFITEPTIDT